MLHWLALDLYTCFVGHTCAHTHLCKETKILIFQVQILWKMEFEQLTQKMHHSLSPHAQRVSYCAIHKYEGRLKKRNLDGSKAASRILLDQLLTKFNVMFCAEHAPLGLQ